MSDGMGLAIMGVWIAVAVISRDKRCSTIGFILTLMAGCSVTNIICSVSK